MRKIALLLLLVIGIVLIPTLAQDATPDPRYVGTVPAPAFPDDVEWLNVDAPLTLDGLRGKIIVLDFWTYGCINCIHMIPVIEQIEETFPDEVVVIGVHSAKFLNEGETENLRQIVQRYNLHHPVINDDEFVVWRSFGANAWPTFGVVDPRGNIVALQSGEVPFEAFERYISGMIEYYDSLGTDEIDRTPLELALEGATDPGTPLRFPGKVLADPEGNRLFIADSNHHRIVVADLTTYEVLNVIGDGQRGLVDGEYNEARFNQPQGMALGDGWLYVADTNNHAIRVVDLEAMKVRTIAGNGIMGTSLAPFGVAFTDAREVPLRSPWDVEVSADGESLYIAMAGMHQVWRMNLVTNSIQSFIGDGREAQMNARLSTSELAQPSGLFLVNGLLYIADSESSTIRAADLEGDSVMAVSGTPNNDLFDYGDTDGAYTVNRLQHPLGVTGNADGSQIYIADTYNSKIKLYDPETQETNTIFGQTGNGGYRDGAADVAAFDEPGGLDYVDGKLYVADTNNHVIRVIDLEAGTVATVNFPNPEALVIDSSSVTVVGGNAAEGDIIELDAQTVAVGDGELVLSLELPEGYKINTLTSSVLEATSDSEAVTFPESAIAVEDTTISLPASFSEGEATVSLELDVFYCEVENETVCLIERAMFDLPVTVSEDGSEGIAIDHTITLPENISQGL
ncbi:MAG: redoxin domain-containing protein [Anaerolineaceae bacterium]|nr:redoxin domain-containing protein [Anaerolineaceae bacterium]